MAKNSKPVGLVEVTTSDIKAAQKAGFKRKAPTFNTSKQNNPDYVNEFVEKYNSWATDLHRAIIDKRDKEAAATKTKEFVSKNVLPFVKKSKKGGISGAKRKSGVAGLAGVKRRAVR